MILALDPSSTCVGYAVMSGYQPAGLTDGGLLRPTPRKLPLLPRVRQFATDVMDLVAECKPSHVVIEVSTTSRGRARSAGHAATLGVYGMAVGYILRALDASGVPVEAVEATVWTRRIPKPQRTQQIASLYGDRYAMARDPGGDLADAIGLGRWWFMHMRQPAGVGPGR